MELKSSHFLQASANPNRRGPERMRPKHLEYLSLALDSFVFGAALCVASVLAGLPEGGLLRVAQALAGLLLFVLFIAGCRFAKLHQPQTLLAGSATSQVVTVLACAGIPPILLTLLCLGILGASDGSVTSLMVWLRYSAILGMAFAAGSRLVYFLARPKIARWLVSPQTVAIVGSGEAARRMIQWINQTSSPLVQVIGVFEDRSKERVTNPDLAGKIRGSTADLIDLYKQVPFDKIVIALPHAAEVRLLTLLRRLRQLPVDIVLAPDLIGFSAAHQGQAELAGLKLYALADRPIREAQRLVKGAIDRTLAGLALLILSPLLLATSLAIKLDSRGPVFFRQPRQGLGDTMFDCFKFRTMRQDLGDADGQQQTRRRDPRVTRIGNLLRRSSIDELPQLLNVLRGEMSLVGPRPHTPHMLIGDKRIFDLVDEYSFRHRVKPGITGLAQVNGFRGAIETPEQLRARVDLDLYYIDHWSLWLDFKIMCRTTMICVSGVNAF